MGAQRSTLINLYGVDGEFALLDCVDELRHTSGAQASKILTVDRLQLQLDNGSDEWSLILDTADFSTVAVLDYAGYERSLIKAVIGAWPETPAPGAGYRFVAECTMQYIDPYGDGQYGDVFFLGARVVSSMITAQAS